LPDAVNSVGGRVALAIGGGLKLVSKTGWVVSGNTSSSQKKKGMRERKERERY
jgi:hypothetical protein